MTEPHDEVSRRMSEVCRVCGGPRALHGDADHEFVLDVDGSARSVYRVCRVCGRSVDDHDGADHEFAIDVERSPAVTISVVLHDDVARRALTLNTMGWWMDRLAHGVDHVIGKGRGDALHFALHAQDLYPSDDPE